ncbi:MAG: CBS domain-containing protein [Gammaproteobacteria bacterium]
MKEKDQILGVYVPVLEVQRSVKAHADLVWGVVTDFSHSATLPPAAKRVETLGEPGEGMTRRIIGADGHAWSESCVDWVEQERYTMRVAAEEFPLTYAALRYTCSLVPNEKQGNVLIRFYIDYQNVFGFIGNLLDRFSNRRRLRTYAHEQLDKWISRIHAREWAYRMTAGSLLDEKGRHLFAVQPVATIDEAAAILREKRCGSVMVLNDDKSIAGVVSERDIVRGLVDEGPEVMRLPVSNIMTREVITAAPADNMMHIMSSMSDHRIRHLPVIEEGLPVGVISIGDVVKARIDELEGQSETLRDYIEARHWHEMYREIGPAAYTEQVSGAEPTDTTL